jgi:pimeloyl-ACP methyl ester carboxylesterase
MKNSLQFIIFIFFFIITSPLRAETACEEFKAEIPLYYKKGTIQVPEDWDHPTGKKISVFYYGNWSNKETPVVFFNGGPSADSHISFGQFTINSQTHNAPFIFIDQRGTGCSSPYPEIKQLNEVEILRFYGSRAIVKDAEAIRNKIIPNRKWKVYGHSYGGLIAHRYLEVAPNFLEGVFIYGNSVMKDWNQFYKLRILSQKRISEEYFKTYPKDQKILENLKTQVPDSECFANEKIRICGNVIFDSFALLLGFHSSWENLHQTLWYLIDKDQKLILPRLKMFVNMSILDPFADQTIATAAIAKMEMMNPNSTSGDDQCSEALKLLKNEGNDLNSWAFNECRLAEKVEYLNNIEFNNMINAFDAKDPLNLESIEKSLLNYPSISFHLYSGKMDAYVPIETYVEELNLLKNRANYVEFEVSGHDGYIIESKIWDDLF